MSGLNFVSTLDNTDFLKGISQMQNGIREVSDSMQNEGTAMNDVMNKITQTAAAFGVGFSAISFVKQVASVRGEFQQLEQSFKTLLGSEEQANDLMKQLVKTAAITPFDLKGVASGAKSLLAYGIEADKVNDKIVQLGNIAAGLNLSISDITMLYGTTVTKDYVDTLDIKQFQNRGIAIKKAIGEVMHLDESEGSIASQVDALVTAKKVTPEIFEKAIESMAGMNGQFAGMMENQSKTISGQISNIMDAVDSMYNEIGKQSEGLISGSLSVVQSVVENYKEVGKAIGEVVVAYGAYKAALMALQAFQGAGAKMETQALKALLAEENVLKDVETEKLVRRGALTEEQAKELITLKAQAKEKLRLTEISIQKAQQDERAAIAVEKEAYALKVQETEIRRKIALREQEIAISRSMGNSIAMETAQEQLNTLHTELNSNAKSQNAMSNKVREASIQKATAQERIATLTTQRDTIQQGLNAAGKQANAKATGLLTIAQQGFSKVMKATGLSMLANPYVLIAAAVAGLTYAIIKAVTYQTEFEKSQEKINKTFTESAGGAASEMAKLQQLTDELARTEKGTEEYELAKQKIVDQFGEYHTGLQDEIDKLIEENELYNILSASILTHYMTKAKSQASEEMNTEYGKSISEETAKIVETLDKLREAEEKAVSGENRTQALADIKKKYSDAINTIRDGIIQGTIEIDKESAKLVKVYEETQKDAEGKEIKVKKTKLFDESEISSDLQKKLSSRWTQDANGAKTYINMLENEIGHIAKSRKLFQQQKEYIDEVYGSYVTPEMEALKKKQEADSKLKELNEQEHKDEMDRLRGLDNLIRQIEEQSKKLESVRAKARAGAEKTDSNGTVIGFYSSEDVEAADKKLKEYKDMYEKLTGVSYDGRMAQIQAIRKAQEEVDQVRKEIAEKERSSIEKEATEARAFELSLQEDSLAKRKAMRELANQKELQQIKASEQARLKAIVDDARKVFDAEQKVEEEIAKARGSKNYVAKTFNEERYLQSDEYKQKAGEVRTSTEKSYQQAIQKQNVAETKAMKQDLEERQSYYEKYLDIEIEYQRKKKEIEDRHKAGELSDVVVRAMQLANEQKRLQAIEKGQYTAEKIGQDMQDVEAIATSIVNNNLEEMIANLELIETRMEEQNGDNSQEQTTKLKAQIAVLKKQLLEQTKQGDLAPDKKSLQQWDKYRDLVSDSIDVLNTLNDVVGDSMKETVETVTVIMNSTMNVINVIQSTAEAAGTSMSLTAIMAAESIKTVEKASVILAIIEAALQVAMAIVNAFQRDDPMNAIRDDVKKTNDAIRQMKRDMALDTSLNDTIFDKGIWADMLNMSTLATQKIAEAKETLLDFAHSYSIFDAYEKFIPIHLGADNQGKPIFESWADVMGINAEGLNDMQDILNQAGEIIKNFRVQTRHSTWFRDEQTKTLKELGYDFYDEMGNLSAEALKKFKETSGEYGHLSTHNKEFIDKLIENVDDYNKALDTLKQNLDSIFAEYGNNLANAISDSFYGVEDAMESFEASVGDMLESMFKNMLIADFFSDTLKQMEDDVMEVFKNGGDNDTMMKEITRITAAGTEEVMKSTDAALVSYEAFMNGLHDAGLMTSKELQQTQEEQGSATYGGYETMSEETGTELSGRFSAMYIVQSEHLGIAKSMLESLLSVTSIGQTINTNLMNIISLQGRATAILSDIRELHERGYTQMMDALSKVARNTQSLE